MKIAEIKNISIPDGWVDFFGRITEVKGIKQRQKSQMSSTPGQQYSSQKLVIADDTGVIGVWAYADKQFMPNQSVTVHGQLKIYQNQKYIDYAEVKIQGLADTSQNSQQTPAAQSPKGQSGVSNTDLERDGCQVWQIIGQELGED